MHQRIAQLLGPLYPFLTKPVKAATYISLCWILTLPLTWPYPLIALLSSASLWLLLISLKFESNILSIFPFPPLTVLMTGLCLRWGIGPLLLTLGGQTTDQFLGVWLQYGTNSQSIWLIFTLILIALYALLNNVLFCKYKAKLVPQSSLKNFLECNPLISQRIKAVYAILSVYMLFYLILTLLSGSFSRQLSVYQLWSDQLWRLDTPVAALSRLRDIWFFLFPISVAIISLRMRLLSLALISSFYSMALLSGSRGLLFYPSALLIAGLWLTNISPLLLRKLFAFLLAILVTLSPIIYLSRSSETFRNAESAFEKYESLIEVFRDPQELLTRARWIGRDLYACHDPFLFTESNVSRPAAGFSGLRSLTYLWLPKHIAPNRPVIFDGHLLAKDLQGYANDPEIMYKLRIWFPCLSLPADLYRRGKILGLVGGSLSVAIVICAYIYLWYKKACITKGSFQLLLFFYPCTYLQSFPFGTLSETAWYLLWELPKYILAMWLIGTLIDRLIIKDSELNV